MKKIDYKIENEKIIVYESKTNKVLFELPNVGRNKISVESLKEDIDKYKENFRKKFFTKPFNSIEDYFDNLVDHAPGRISIILVISLIMFISMMLTGTTKFVSTLFQYGTILGAEVAIEPIIRKWLPTKEEKEFKKAIKESYNKLITKNKEKTESIELVEEKEESLKIEEQKNKSTEEYTIKPTAYSENYTYDDQTINNVKKR